MNTSGHTGGLEVPQGRLLLSEAETALALSISPRTLFSLRKSGRLIASKIGSRVVYHVDEVRRFANESVGKTIPV